MFKRIRLTIAPGKARYVAQGMLFENIEINGRTRTFRVHELDGEQRLGQFGATSRVTLATSGKKETPARASPKITRQDVGGLARPIDEINEVLLAGEDTRSIDWFSRPTGLLLHGPKGTGKTLLLDRIAATGWGKVLHVDCSTSIVALRKVFADAKLVRPSLVVIDQMEILTSRTGDLTFAAVLSHEMGSLRNDSGSAQVLVVGATSQLGDIPDILRGPNAFQFEIEIPIPDTQARIDILKCLTKTPISADDPLLESYGSKTHGYTGADLWTLLWTANCIAASRRRQRASQLNCFLTNGDREKALGKDLPTTDLSHGLLGEDFEKALFRTRPSAMREISLEVPQVKWSDIGGQEEVKQCLREAVEWPLRYPDRMRRAGLEPKKGLLLYGPPGCSKTLIAKALATEAGFNFIAVKGPELLNMYVGESERALRNVFSKARAASPSIIFFDEIDTIASRREHRKESGLHCLETLLNEMDGIETLRGVFVLAATNKPDVLDLALLRPGRFDSILYVGPPNLPARVDILRANLAKMDVEVDVNILALAEDMGGHSGAEIVDICQKAGHQWFREMMETGDDGRKVAKEDFERAMREVPRQISETMRRKYERWRVGESHTI